MGHSPTSVGEICLPQVAHTLMPAPVSPAMPTTMSAAPARACIVLNPRSFRASVGRLASGARDIARRLGADVIEASDLDEFSRALDRAIDHGCAEIAVLAGDGTVQAIADHLARVPASQRPALLVLGGGRTNLIAADVGGRGAMLRKLEQHLQRLAAGETLRTQERMTFVVEQTPAPPRHGFFLAGARVDTAIRACHAHRDSGRTALHQGHLSNPYCLLKLGARKVLGRSRMPLKCTLDIAADGLGSLSGPIRLFAVSTLSYAKGLLHPFAPRGTGAVRVTAICGGAKAFWWRLPRVLLGRFTSAMQPENGYLSGRCGRVEILGMATYTLDGEKFDCDPTRPVIIREGVALRFVIPD